MRVTHVSLRPTEAAERAGRPALTPELLAASGARYSRNNEGLESILARIDPEHLDRSVDSIFKMIDYGHASIADMAPVALFIDGVSLWLAYYLWTLSPTAGGQESSTRYLQLSVEHLVPAETLGIPAARRAHWQASMQAAFEAYQKALAFWEEIARSYPERVRIPRGAGEKAAARMRRNFAFDRARYFLPTAAATNVVLVMSARAWVTLCQHLLSHPLPEMRACGEAIREELGLAAPRLLKHAQPLDSLRNGIAREFEQLRARAQQSGPPSRERLATPHLEVLLPSEEIDFAGDLAFHANRYAYQGEGLRRTAVRFGWQAVALAEIRDLNRHRTGTKFCPPVPVGFYHAADELPAADAPYAALAIPGVAATRAAWEQLTDEGDPGYVYQTLLGTQLPFEHTTTADKFLYEAELRTGTGAHFRYAQHLHDVLTLWYDRYPQTRGLVLEGSAEPE